VGFIDWVKRKVTRVRRVPISTAFSAAMEATPEGNADGIFRSAALPVAERSTTKTSGDGLYEVYAGVPVVCSTTRAPSRSTAVSDMAAGSALTAFAESAGAGASFL